jgi:hypothetical protein
VDSNHLNRMHYHPSSVAELSLVLDMPLMHAIAQASATFIAILAGFYTSKILSIASDKNRLAAKAKEIQNEIEWRRSNALENDRIVNEIYEENERSLFQAFRDYNLVSYFSPKCIK